MKATNFVDDKVFVVTKGNKSFHTGHHIWLDSRDNTLVDCEATGWIDAEDVEFAIIGLECRPDTEHVIVNGACCKRQCLDSK